MRHILLNLTWKCQLKCSYCWVRRWINKTPGLDNVTERPFEDWKNAVARDGADIVDLGGGEPLSVPWTLDLIRHFPDIRWGLSTNGLNTDKIDELSHFRIPQIININLSYHPEASRQFVWYDEQWKSQVLKLAERGYWLSPNLEDTGKNVEYSQWAIKWLESIGLHMVVSPLCGGRPELAKPQSLALMCEGGVNFITVDPAGNAWPCLSAINSFAWEETCLGNWLDGELDLSSKPKPCYLYCVDYFVQSRLHESGDFWGINARPFKEDE